MRESSAEAFYLPSSPGRRFCILHTPVADEALRGSVLHIHPFAEELNKCRRMTALLAKALAEDGWAVMQMDLFGCGDSSGEFAEASWDGWLDDICTAYQWLRSRYQGANWLWGLRAGCLLAGEVLPRLPESPGLLLWQPVQSGRQHLTQFLRLRLANEIMGDSGERSGVQSLRQKLVAGELLDIAGYELSAAVAMPLDRAELKLSPGYQGRIVWVEVSHNADASLSPGSAARIARFSEEGRYVQASAVPGDLFWQTIEIAECPELIAKTVTLIGDAR